MTDADQYGDRVGWHRDPTGRYEYRWFNGVTWTGDVATGGRQSVDPLGVAPTPLARSSRRGLAIASMIIGIASLLLAMLPIAFVGGAVGAIVAIVMGAVALRAARRERTAAQTDPGVANGPTATGPAATGRAFAIAGLLLGVAALPTCALGYYFSAYLVDRIEEITDIGDFRTVVDSCDVGDYTITMQGTLTNLDDTEHWYDITVAFWFEPDAGVAIDLGTATVTNLRVAAGESASFTAGSFDVVDGMDPTKVSCTIDSVEASVPFRFD